LITITSNYKMLSQVRGTYVYQTCVTTKNLLKFAATIGRWPAVRDHFRTLKIKEIYNCALKRG